MPLESLLLSQDIETVRILRPTLEKLSIEVEVCQEARKATEILMAEKFDAVIVDCDDLPGGAAVLQGLRNTPSNRNSVTFAVLNGRKTTTQEAFGMGVNFVLQKPVSALNASRCFHAALSFMERERRRYYRQPVKVRVKIVLDDNKAVNGTSTNISEGGMAVVVHQALPKNASPRLQFILPGTTVPFEVEAVVAWADIKGHVGLRFLHLPPNSQEPLERWLGEQLENVQGASENLPGANAQTLP
jgi:DNA-binding response OmpR family regulator